MKKCVQSKICAGRKPKWITARHAPSLVLIKWKGQKVLGGQHTGWEEWFDLDRWTCDLKINRDHLLIEINPCAKFGIDQVKGSKDIERTTQWAEKSGLTLTFKHVTWKSIGFIYSLRAIPAPSLVLIKRRGQKILSGQHLVYTLSDRHTKQYALFFKGDIKIESDALCQV